MKKILLCELLWTIMCITACAKSTIVDKFYKKVTQEEFKGSKAVVHRNFAS